MKHWLTLFLFLAATSVVVADDYIFRRVVTNGTSLPDRPGSFISLGSPSLDSGSIAFWGRADDQLYGLYQTTGSALTTIVSPHLPAPGGGHFNGSFTGGTYAPPQDGSAIAFIGVLEGPPEALPSGIYKYDGGSFVQIAAKDQATPDGSNTFRHLDVPSFDDGDMAFRAQIYEGSLGSRQGIYTTVGGTLRRIVDTNSPAPGYGTFRGFSGASIEGDVIAFGAYVGPSPTSFQATVFAERSGQLQVLVDQSTPIPGRTENFFNQVTSPKIDGGKIIFWGRNASNTYEGLFAHDGTSFSVILDSNDPAPGGLGNLSRFTSFAAEDGHIAIYEAAHQAIYADLGGTLQRLIGLGDVLDNKIVSYLILGETGVISDGELAFRAEFTNGSQGLYVAAFVPEPSSLVMIAFGGVAMLMAGSKSISRSHKLATIAG